MNFFLGYLLPVIFMLLIIGFLFMTDCKVYIWHILTFIFAFIPIGNWIAFMCNIILVFICLIEDMIEIKSNKVTKFLFNIK